MFQEEEIHTEFKSDIPKRLAKSWAVGWKSLKAVRSNAFNNFATGEILHCHEMAVVPGNGSLFRWELEGSFRCKKKDCESSIA